MTANQSWEGISSVRVQRGNTYPGTWGWILPRESLREIFPKLGHLKLFARTFPKPFKDRT
eukprot:836522-Pleurochrysis_carterae.AAC.3